jgi:hypothetical protein
VLLFSALLLLLSAGVSCVTLFMKFFTTLAVPNWATTVMGFALVISIQALMMPVLMAFMLLNARSTVHRCRARLRCSLWRSACRSGWCGVEWGRFAENGKS